MDIEFWRLLISELETEIGDIRSKLTQAPGAKDYDGYLKGLYTIHGMEKAIAIGQQLIAHTSRPKRVFLEEE